MIFIVVVLAYFLFKEYRKSNRLEETILEQRTQYDVLASYVFNEAKFPDNAGRSDGDYMTEDVQFKWSRFHELNANFNRIGKK